MSKATKNPAKNRDQALNDATGGQFGREPRPEVEPNLEKVDQRKNIGDAARKVANREKYLVKK